MCTVGVMLPLWYYHREVIIQRQMQNGLKNKTMSHTQVLGSVFYKKWEKVRAETVQMGQGWEMSVVWTLISITSRMNLEGPFPGLHQTKNHFPLGGTYSGVQIPSSSIVFIN